MNNFWTNIIRYPRFFISSMIGLILIILRPFKNLFKIPKLRWFGILNRFLKGFNIININPIILLIKKRGYRIIFVQKLFIIMIN